MTTVATPSSAPAPMPRTRWSLHTGGQVRDARIMDVDGDPWVLALAGTVLQTADDTGRPRWSSPRRVVSRVIAAGDLTGTGAPTVLVRGTQRELALLDGRTGSTLWAWWAPDGTFINDAGAVLMVPWADGHRLLVAPIYGSTIEAFDLAGPGPVRPAWTLHGSWDAGFGPSLVAADMDMTGVPRVVLSSRRGDTDRTRDGHHTSAETVLGKRHGLLYQAIVDCEDGRIMREVAWPPNPRGHRCARPYGLLTAVPFVPGGRPGIVMACCQVEEYLAVTRQLPDGTLRRGWSRFVEKDWPVDRRELRVHPDSVRELRRDGHPELVSSLWDGRRWRTSIQDLATGRDRAGDRLVDRVVWGCLDGTRGRTWIVASRATERSVRGPMVIEIIDGASLEVADRRRDAQVVLGNDRPPQHVAFMAERRGVARLHIDGAEAAVVRGRDGSLHAWWPDGSDGARSTRIGTSRDVSVYGGPGWALVSDRSGGIRRVGPPFGSTGTHPRFRTHGRVAPVAATWDATGPFVGVELPGSRIRVIRPGVRNEPPGIQFEGSQLALRLGDGGAIVAHAFTRQDRGRTLLCIHRSGPGSDGTTVVLDAPLDRPAHWLDDGSLLLTLRTGTHTLATESRWADGRLRWRLDAGAYLHGPAAVTIDGSPLVLVDDHGVLHAIDASQVDTAGGVPRPVVRWTRDWTAAYSQPIAGPFLPDGRMAVLRANGIHGIELLGPTGRRRWRTESPLWRYATGDAIVARSQGSWTLVAGRRDGVVDGVDLRDGRVSWQLPLCEALDDLALAAADVDQDGDDEVVVGSPDGRLVLLGALAHQPLIRWTRQLDAGVSAIQVLPGPGPTASLVVVTVDGRVQLLDLPTAPRPRAGTHLVREPHAAGQSA